MQDGIDQTTRYAYDGTGGLTKITVNDPAGKTETLYTKAYNEAGQLTDKTDTSGKNTANSYSSRGLVEEMRDRNGTITNYQYDERGQRTVATLTATNGNTLQTKTIFGSGGNILTDRHELYLNGTKTATQTSTIDKQDRITSLTSTGTNQYSSRLDVAYDTLDRITNQKNSLSGSSFFTNYGYDKLRLSQIQTNGAQTRNTAKANNVNYEYTPLGMVQAITFPTLADGSVLKESFTYDALNRLSQMSNTKGSSTLSAYSYTYDNNGNILTVSESLNGGEVKTSTYTYDKLNRLATVKRIDGSTASYTYDLRGNRVLVKKDQTASKDYYYLFNGHGDVVQMVDTSGTIVNSYGYDEWGNIAKQQETVSNSFKYAGESYDSETGLYYLKSRYYDPSQGRFLNEDSYEGQITNPLSLNNYTYVENSPLIYIDPLGFAASYVFYTTNPDSNFKAQADFQKERLEKNGDTVNMMESNTIEKFEDGWNNIGVVDGKQVEVNEVVIISHTRENVIIFQDGTSTNAMSISGKNSSGQKIGNFSQLESKKMTSLTFLTCNAGHLATFSTGNDNLASYFLKNKVDGGIVYAYDGNVVFGSKWTRWATNDLTSRLSSEQDTHYSILKKYHQKARKPYGKVSYHIDENGKVLAGF